MYTKNFMDISQELVTDGIDKTVLQVIEELFLRILIHDKYTDILDEM